MKKVNNLWIDNKGFTLIEMLVVIAVIAMAMALFFPNFMGARQRARDTQRKSDLRQIQQALELYKLDQANPAYPASINTCSGCWSSGADCTGNIYMRRIPCDPGSTEPIPYYYKQGSDILTYTLTACLENIVDPDRDPAPDVTNCPTSNTSYTIYEP